MEWAFTLVRNNGLFVRKSRTDSLPDDVTPDLFLASSDTVIGFWHAHQGNTSWLNLNICFSVQDYWYIYQKLRRNNVVVYATTRDFVYALIITDATKFKNYLDGNNTRLVEPFLNNLYNQGEQSCGNCSASRLSEKANI